MAVDISNDPLTQAWKSKYIAMGLPETLLNDFINEANAEYNSQIGFGDIKRMAQLRINISDPMPLEEAFYRINICWGAILFMGEGTQDDTYNFSQVPCVKIHIEVFKISNDGTTVLGYGFALFNHSKDESVTITINNFSFSQPATTYILIHINNGIIGTAEHVTVADSLAVAEAVSYAEGMVKTN